MKHNLFLSMLILLTACQSEPPPAKLSIADNLTDSFHTALPHGASLPSGELSEEDRLKLSKATGLKATDIKIDSLLQLIERDTQQLFIYSFWNLDCQSCLKMNEQLKSLQYDALNRPHYEMVYVNLDPLYPNMVNAYLRENNILSPVYNVERSNVVDWTGRIETAWQGELPALLIVRKSEGLKLFYQQKFTKEELQALIEPLTL